MPKIFNWLFQFRKQISIIICKFVRSKYLWPPKRSLHLKSRNSKRKTHRRNFAPEKFSWGIFDSCGVLLIIAFSSYFFSWKVDQSNLSLLADRSIETKNLLSKLGAEISHLFIYEGVGIAAYIFAYLILSSVLLLF